MAFYFYFNHPNRKVRIHKGECNFCNEGQGVQNNVHGERNGGWRGGFSSYKEARNEAQAVGQEIGVNPSDCGRCRPGV